MDKGRVLNGVCHGAEAIAALSPSSCGRKKFRLNSLGDHVCTCTHSGAKKAHDWAVTQFADLFRTTTKTTSTHASHSRGQRCEEIELAVFLVGVVVPINIVMDLRIANERFGNSSNPLP